MSTPEWSIFDRLDELEDITLRLMEKTDTTEPTLKNTSTVARDANILAKLGFLLAFVSAIGRASNHIETKDSWVRILKASGLSERMLGSIVDSIDEFMLSVYGPVEKQKDKD